MFGAARDSLVVRAGRLVGGPLLMGILNVTPDSFSDGGRSSVEAIDLARSWGDDAAIVDVGGESTRPGAIAVSLEDERARVLPVVAALADRLVSIDTYKARVADEALAAGATIVNDVSGGLLDPAILDVVARRGAFVILGHMRGDPTTMSSRADYRDVVGEVCDELAMRIGAAKAAGIAADRILLDPGIGFAKRTEHNAALLARLGELRGLGCPVVVGVSRKRFLAELGGDAGVLEREEATAAANAIAIWNGADVIRVHDVARQARGLRVAARLMAMRVL